MLWAAPLGGDLAHLAEGLAETGPSKPLGTQTVPQNPNTRVSLCPHNLCHGNTLGERRFLSWHPRNGQDLALAADSQPPISKMSSAFNQPSLWHSSFYRRRGSISSTHLMAVPSSLRAACGDMAVVVCPLLCGVAVCSIYPCHHRRYVRPHHHLWRMPQIRPPRPEMLEAPSGSASLRGARGPPPAPSWTGGAFGLT